MSFHYSKARKLLNILNEGSSVFSEKLYSFVKPLDKENQEFVKKVLNSIYLGFRKDFNGYIEGKRPVIKKYHDYEVMTWKIQTSNDALS